MFDTALNEAGVRRRWRLAFGMGVVVLSVSLGVGIQASCQDATAPDPGVLLTVTEQGTGPVVEPSAEARAETSQLVVEGELSAANPCRFLSGRREDSEGAVTLRVEVEANEDQACPDEIGFFRYRAILRPVSAGPLKLTVIHDYRDGSNWPTATVLEENVVVR